MSYIKQKVTGRKKNNLQNFMMLRVIKKIFVILSVIFIIEFIFIELFVTLNTSKVSDKSFAEQILLPIKDIKDDPQRPANVGWCAEASIQMACLYFGAYIPQSTINIISKPSNPDLYYNDIPKTIELLNLTYNSWYDQPNLLGVSVRYLQGFWRGKNHNINNFINWIKYELSLNNPVLIGVKIYPDKHSDWWIDHFMLAIGFSNSALIFNPTGQGTQRESFKELISKGGKYSFSNKYNYYYGYSITGFNFLREHEIPILNIQKTINDTTVIEIRVRKSESFAIYRYSTDKIESTFNSDEMKKEIIGFLSQENSYRFLDRVPKKYIAFYRLLEN